MGIEPSFLGRSACTLVTNLTELFGRIASQFSARSLLILNAVVVLVPTNKCQGSNSNYALAGAFHILYITTSNDTGKFGAG
jgi:hypothetical protein